MNIQPFSKIEHDDLLKLVLFASELNNGFDNFENTTLDALKDIFAYPVTSYSIWGCDDINQTVLYDVFSHYFNEQHLIDYADSMWKDDLDSEDWDAYRAKNAQFPIAIRHFDDKSQNPFDKRMINNGVNCQIIIGSNISAAFPLHSLCIYKAIGTEIDDYEHLLLECIAEIFNSIVGKYKASITRQTILSILRRNLDSDPSGLLFYNRDRTIIECNEKFRQYGKMLADRSSVSEIISFCMRQLDFSGSGTSPAPVSCRVNDFDINLEPAHTDAPDKTLSEYCIIRITPKSNVPATVRKPANHYLDYGLTKREAEVADYLAQGYSNQEISEAMFISMPTVKTHIENIYTKFNVHSRREFFKILEAVKNHQ